MLKDKIIIVTGGSGLIGKALVEDIRKKGGTAINADISVEDDLSSGSLYCDVTDETSINATLQKVKEEFGRIDGLVNNAYPRTKDWGLAFEHIPFSSWKKNMDMQLNSVFVFCQKALAFMKEQGSGAIVNISSIYGVVGNDFTVYENTNIVPPAAYSAIKGGLINFTKYLASYYGPFNVRVNCVSPGGIFDGQPEKFVEQYEKKVPMKRMGKPKDIAPGVSFLLSDGAEYITGQNLVIDGGWTSI